MRVLAGFSGSGYVQCGHVILYCAIFQAVIVHNPVIVASIKHLPL